MVCGKGQAVGEILGWEIPYMENISHWTEICVLLGFYAN
jgi:hypothetical protein